MSNAKTSRLAIDHYILNPSLATCRDIDHDERKHADNCAFVLRRKEVDILVGAWTPENTAPVAANGLRASDLILLPQDLEDVTLRIEYTIKNNGAGSEELKQIAELPLNGSTVSKWVMGKRYIYNITIGLETIYFEPYVQDWVDVAAGDLTI